MKKTKLILLLAGIALLIVSFILPDEIAKKAANPESEAEPEAEPESNDNVVKVVKFPHNPVVKSEFKEAEIVQD